MNDHDWFGQDGSWTCSRCGWRHFGSRPDETTVLVSIIVHPDMGPDPDSVYVPKSCNEALVRSIMVS